jgi:hypothetical protein
LGIEWSFHGRNSSPYFERVGIGRFYAGLLRKYARIRSATDVTPGDQPANALAASCSVANGN